MATLRKDGGRTIELLLPFKHEGKSVTLIGLAPVTWGHTLKWQGGEYTKSLDLLFELCEQPEAVIRSLRYPDVDRVMTQFFDMLPPEIRESIANGTIPQKIALPPAGVEVPIEEVITEGDAGEPVPDQPEYTPYRPPTQSEISEDLKSHPPPDDPWAHLPKDDTGLGFEVGS